MATKSSQLSFRAGVILPKKFINKMNNTTPTLTEMVAQLSDEVRELKRLIMDKTNEQQQQHQQQQEPDRWLTITELCQYHPEKPARQTVYSWVNNAIIPVHKTPGGKKLRFLKSEVDAWLKSGGKKTFLEIEAEADSYLKHKQHN